MHGQRKQICFFWDYTIDAPRLRGLSLRHDKRRRPETGGQAFITTKLSQRTGGVNTENIKRLRLARGIGQAELARRIGVTPAAVLLMESPGTYPGAERLPLIAKALGCTIDDLFGVEAPKQS